MTREIERLVEDIVDCADEVDGGRIDARELCGKLIAAVRKELANVQVGGQVAYDQSVKWRLSGGPYDTAVFAGPSGARISIPKDGRHHVYERTGVIEATYVGDCDFEELQKRMREARARPSVEKARRQKRGVFRTIK